jgi:hypothetical protein
MIKEIAFSLKVNRIFLLCIDAGKWGIAAKIAEKHMSKRQIIGLFILSRRPKKQSVELVFESEVF